MFAHPKIVNSIIIHYLCKQLGKSKGMEKIYEYENMKEISILDYYPTKIQESSELTPEQQIVSQFVINFKNGYQPASVLAAKIVAKTISQHFNLGQERPVFIPIPASNNEDTIKRYHLFSYLVSQRCPVIDGHTWVKNWQETEKKHLSQDHIVQDNKNRWFVDYAKIKNAKVIIFDDISTTGETAASFIQRLEECGAKVIGEVFLASTFNIKKNLQNKKTLNSGT